MPAVDPGSDLPFTPAQLNACLLPFAGARRAALAVSGGGDSVAMMALVHRWLENRALPEITVLSVDHGLRAQAGAELRKVAAWAKAFGFSHKTLEWTGRKPKRGLQAAAREARYGLMLDWCGAHQVSHLGLAHTMDDQAETVMMRLMRGSGVDGLSAMAPVVMRAGVHLVRPLLDVRRQRLRDALAALGQPWVEDPSNRDSRFERVRVRKLLESLEQEGFTPEKLAVSARRLTRAREALDNMAHQASRQCVAVYDAGFCVLDMARLGDLGAEIGIRVLKACLTGVGGLAYGPRLEQIEALYAGYMARGVASRTLGGCRLLARGDHGVIAREAGREGLPECALAPGARRIWDRRFEIALEPKAAKPFKVRALGRRGWQVLGKLEVEKPRLPAPVAQTLLSFWSGRSLAAVPHLAFYAQPDYAELIEARFLTAATIGSGRSLDVETLQRNDIFTKRV